MLLNPYQLISLGSADVNQRSRLLTQYFVKSTQHLVQSSKTSALLNCLNPVNEALELRCCLQQSKTAVDSLWQSCSDRAKRSDLDKQALQELDAVCENSNPHILHSPLEHKLNKMA